MKLFVNGCSYSYGGNIYPLYDDDKLITFYTETDVNKQRLSNIWSYHLGKNLGVKEVVNYSLCSNSNEAILRTSLDYLDNLSDYNDLRVVIQWSNPDRFEFYDEINRGWIQISGSKSWLFVPDDPDFDFSNQNEYFINHIQERLDIFYKHFYSEYEAVIKSLNHFELLGEYLENRKIKYVFCLLTYGLFDKLKHTTIGIKNKIDHISNSYRWFNNDMSCSTLRPVIPENMLTISGHPDLNGHKEIASRLHSYIK